MMKIKTIVFVLLFAWSSSVMAQEAVSVDTNTYIYCELVAAGDYGARVMDPFQMHIYVDFPDKSFNIDKKAIESCSSSSSALSLLGKQGWILTTSTSVYYGSKLVHHHFMRRLKFTTKSTQVLPIKP